MSLDWKLQDYLNSKDLSVRLNGQRFEIRDKEGQVVSTGASASIAVMKVMWMNMCHCQLTEVGRKKDIL